MQRKLFYHFCISYFIVLIIPFGIGIALYYYSAQTVKHQAVQLQYSAQETVMQSMDNYLDQCDKIALQFSFDADIMKLSQPRDKSISSKEIVHMMDAMKKMNFYIIESAFWDNFSLVFPQSGMAISKEHVSSELPFYYENILFFPDYSYDNWLTLLDEISQKTTLPMQTIKKNGIRKRALLHLIPINSYKDGHGVALFLLEESVLRNYLTFGEDEQHIALVLDENSQVIYQSSLLSSQNQQRLVQNISEHQGVYEDTFSDEKMLVVYTESSENRWKYVSVIPTVVALGEVVAIRNIIFLIGAITLVFGVFFVIGLSYRNSSPIQNALALMERQGNINGCGQSGLKLLETGVTDLIYSSESIRTRLERQNEVIHALHIERLLSGVSELDKNEMQIIEEQFPELEKHSLVFTVILFRFIQPQKSDSILQIERLHLTLASLLERDLPDIKTSLFHILNSNELSLILGARQESLEDTTRKLLEDYQRRFASEQPCYVGVGSCGSGIESIRESYRAACFVIEHEYNSRIGVIFYYDEITPCDTFLYSPLVEIQLTGKVRSGDSGETERILDDIYRSNFEGTQLMPYMVKGLLYNLYCTFLKISDPLNMEAVEISKIFVALLEQNKGEYQSVFQKIKEAFLHLTKEYDVDKKSHNTIRIGQIKDYITDHYNDCDLSAAAIAGIFQITEGYYSQYFKEQTGFNYSVYIANYRISRSCQLLRDTCATIADIAEQVGYANVYSFRRAFKRITGTLPSEFRENDSKQESSSFSDFSGFSTEEKPG